MYPSGPDPRDRVFGSITDEERSQQMSPLCQTPTSQLLKMAAQFLPQSPCLGGSENKGPDTAVSGPQSAFDLLKQGWWRASPSQLQEVSTSIKNAGIVEHISELDLVEDLQNLNLPKDLAAKLTEKKEDKQSHNSVENELSKHNSVPNVDNEITDKNKETKNIEIVKKKEGNKDDYKVAVQSLSATLSYLRQQKDAGKNEGVSTKRLESSDSHKPISLLKKVTSSALLYEVKAKNPDVEAASKITADEGSAVQTAAASVPLPGTKPLQPGSYWYAKQFQNKTSSIELPQHSSKEVRQVIASLASSKPSINPYQLDVNESREDENAKEEDTVTLQGSIDVSESHSSESLTDLPDALAPKNEQVPKVKNIIHAVQQERVKSVQSARVIKFDHDLENCVAEDCMCYEAIFRPDQPIETSSVKSESSFSESPECSPVKVLTQHGRSTSSLSDDSINSSINKRKSRIAAKFVQPLE